MSPLPTVESRQYEESDLRQVDELLALGARRGLTAGVQVLRRALDAQRDLLTLAGNYQYLVPPRATRAPVTERRSPRQVMATENTEPVARKRCGHPHPTKGPCLADPHPDKPRAHAYSADEVTVRRTPPRHDRPAFSAQEAS